MATVHESQVVIVGAGVSGLALALHLGQRGHRVLLVDHARAPRDKVCGEGIMPLGLRCLAALAIQPASLPGVDFDGLDYLAAWSSPWVGAVSSAATRENRAAGSAATGPDLAASSTVSQNQSAIQRRHPLRFPHGVRGRGVRRTRLIETLERAALSCPQVRLIQDDVRGVEWDPRGRRVRVAALVGNDARYEADIFVAADGVNSRLARWCGGDPCPYGERYALRRHYRLPPGQLPPRVQVGLLGSHDLYLTPVAPDELLATTLTSREGYRAVLAATGGYDGFLREGPCGSWFADAEPVSECLHWYHPLFHVRRYVAGGVLLVGDAGGGIDPCLGLGMSFALHTSLAAGEAIHERLRHRSNPAGSHATGWEGNQARSFELARCHLFLHTHYFGRVFRALVGSRSGARLLMWTMGRMPRMADRVLAVVADLRPWSSLLGLSMSRQSPPITDGFGAPPQGMVAPAGGEKVSPVQQP